MKVELARLETLELDWCSSFNKLCPTQTPKLLADILLTWLLSAMCHKTQIKDRNRIKFGSFRASNNCRTILRHSECRSESANADIKTPVLVAEADVDAVLLTGGGFSSLDKPDESDINDVERSQPLLLIENSDIAAHE